jgi:lysophospholipid hydrolase
VILTRFSRVTFNVAHKYLGLTTELLRTEKAINELARHPLPSEFYQGGGMQWLRQRFMPDFKDDNSGDAPVSDKETDFFGSAVKPSPARSDMGTPKSSTVFSSPAVSPEESPINLIRRRSQVNAGDLLSMTTSPSSYLPHYGSKGSLFVPGGRSRNTLRGDARHAPSPPDERRGSKTNDFDLKEGVMDCIAKSIGLIQPPISGIGSPEASPSLVATEPVYPSFSSSFRSLSFLSTADDASSVTAGSSVFNRLQNDTIDNEVEILFFKSGDTLVHAGERNAGNPQSALPLPARY